MLGIIGTPPLPLHEVLDAFYPLNKEGRVQSHMPPGHFDGWGMSGYSSNRAVYFERRAEPALQGRPQYVKACEKALRTQSPVVLVHFRKDPDGMRDLSNTHPFHYKDWAFAHSGTIFNPEILRLEDSRAQGGTDSEHLMLWLIERMGNTADPTAAITRLLKDWRDRLEFSSLTFLLTNGATLWAYRDFAEHRLAQNEILEEREKYFTLHSTRVDRSAVISSEPLKDVSKFWQPIAPRTLAVFSPQMLAPQTINI